MAEKEEKEEKEKTSRELYYGMLGDILLLKGLITKEQMFECLAEQRAKGGFLGEIMVKKGFVSSQEVEEAIREQKSVLEAKGKGQVRKILLATKLITEEQMKEAVEEQKVTGLDLAQVLINKKFIAAKDMGRVLEKVLDIPYIDLTGVRIDPQIIQLLPEEVIRRQKALPIRLEGDRLYVAMVSPSNLPALEELRLISGYKIKPIIAAERELAEAINRQFTMQTAARQAIIDLRTRRMAEAPEVEEAAPTELAARAEEAPIIRLVDSIINGAVNAGASDIHLEPQEPEMRVRYRLDGMLHDIMTIPKHAQAPTISRIKILADLDITERRHPQDGHISIKREEREFDLRVSTLLTVNGEKVVMRILDRSSMLLGLEELGFSDEDFTTYLPLITKPYGMILVTGPTGSGKTTTLYATLNRINTPEKNIITIEDPVEYRLPGMNQSQINPHAGITFASGLRSIVRQDPDVIMVGEIRDLETAQIAIQAALTGHLVFSTLHTNDAPSAVIRLIDMGIPPFLISSSVIGALAQRLVRTICPNCKEEYEPSKEELGSIGLTKKEGMRFYRGKGCEHCYHTGYRGRTGAFELMRMDEKVQELVTARRPTQEIKEAAIRAGMKTLRESGLEKIKRGISTIAEVKRVIYVEEV